MGKIWILGRYFLSLCFIFSVHIYVCNSQEQQDPNTYTVSSFTYASTKLTPYGWRYIRVELPPWFSSLSISLESDAEPDLHGLNNTSIISLPMICFREGSPPLPDVYNASLTGLVIDHISNDSFSGTQSLQNAEKCYPMQKKIKLRMTNEQISPGLWYFGLFNGIGPVRTQSKMINRGYEYSFSGNVTVEGCMTSTMLGPFCNQTVNMLSCKQDSNSITGKNVIACEDSQGIACHEDNTPKIYLLDVTGIAEELFVAVSNVTFNGTQYSPTTTHALMCYVRHGAMPTKTNYDFAGDISKTALVVSLPKAGRWYITVQPIDISSSGEALQSSSLNVCYLLKWQIFQCPLDKAGLNCTFEKYNLQAVLRENPTLPFESNYIPITKKVSPNSPNFPLEPLLSNFSTGPKSNDAWTFFLLDVPYGGSGANIHVHLDASAKINYELYAKYGGLPSLSSWDYFYANASSSSKGSMFFKIYDSSEKKISFYMLYVRGGTWGIGLRQLNSDGGYAGEPRMSLSLERCPQKCSSHGSCQSTLDTSGLGIYSYCFCDRDHGGFDCSVELVSHRGHIRQSIFLIASNAAAILPAYWSLRSKAFAEWIIFTSSGTASALYHACDVGTWCVLTFHVLQFLDFWLSFIAIVGTFVYLSPVSELSKRTIHTIVAILTALLAETGPTRPRNVILVMSIGTLALLLGWLFENGAVYRSISCSREFHMNLLDRWEIIKGWSNNAIKTIIRRFRWKFVIAGFITAVFAGLTWTVETIGTYWIWHSLWHIFAYTSSFLFLCSKGKAVNYEEERTIEAGAYELTRQNSLQRR